jgi:hypothetical protein
MDPIEIVINGTDKGFLKTLQTAVRAENEMKDGLEKIKKKSEEAGGSLEKLGKSGQKSFGSQALGMLQSFTGGMASLQGAVQLVSSAVNQLNADAAAAVSAVSKLTDQRKEMAQLAKNPADYYKLKTRAQELSTTYGLDQEKAHSITNAARAGGFEGSLDQVALAAATFANAEDLSQTAAILPMLFKGLSPEQAINLAAAGGTESKSMTFRGISNEMVIGARGAAAAGSSAVETGALTTILSDAFGRSTGDRLAAFGTKVSLNKELAGKGIMGAAEALQAMPEERRKAFLKDDLETNQVYNALVQRGADVRAMEKKLQAGVNATGTANAPLAIGANAFLEDRENRAMLNANVAAQRAERNNQDLNAVYALNKQQAANEQRSFVGGNPVGRFFVEAGEWLPGVYGNTTDFAAQATAKARGPGPVMQPEIVQVAPALQAAAQHVKETTQALKNTAVEVQHSRNDAQQRRAMGNRE